MKQVVEQIRAALAPSMIISRKVALKSKTAGEFVGLCPFHSEKTPSFTVSDVKGFYHCFGCGEHGDIFTFIMKNDGYDYKHALEYLANEAGISLPKYSPKQIEEERQLQTSLNIFELVTQYYQSKLKSPIGREAYDYLKSRELNDEVIELFRLGFAPNNQEELIGHLQKYYSKEAILVSGALGKPNAEKLYNMFRGRVIFPIVNRSGRVIAFGGRSIDGSEPKYLNSAENPVFIKGRELFGLNHAAPVALKEGRILLVEGYMDVISLANKGIGNAVAPLGTAAKMEQIKLLWNYSPEPIICMDSDNAGKNAAKKIASMMVASLVPGKSLRFLTIEGGKDPDEIITKYGKSHFQKLLKNAVNLSDFLFENEVSSLISTAPEHLANLKNKLNEIAEQINNFELKKAYKSFFNEKFFNTFVKKVKAAKGKKQEINQSAIISETLAKESPYVMGILRVLVDHPEYIADLCFRERLLHLEIHTKSLDNVRNQLLSISELGSNDLKFLALENLKKQLFGKKESILNEGNASSKVLTLSSEDPRSMLERLFDLVELNMIYEKVAILSKKLIESPSEEIFQKLKAIKELEEKLKLNLGIS